LNYAAGDDAVTQPTSEKNFLSSCNSQAAFFCERICANSVFSAPVPGAMVCCMLELELNQSAELLCKKFAVDETGRASHAAAPVASS